MTIEYQTPNKAFVKHGAKQVPVEWKTPEQKQQVIALAKEMLLAAEPLTKKNVY